MILLMPRSTRVFSLVPSNAAGYCMAPTPMIAPWPACSRGTEWLVPMPPGLVSEMVVPAKSSAVSLLLRAFLTMSSYACQNCRNVMFSVPFTEATTSVRELSLPFMSMASPKFTCSGVIENGLPSISW